MAAPAYGHSGNLAELGLADLLAVRAVTGARHDQRVIDSPRAITIITAEDIQKRNYRNTAAALLEAAGVFMQLAAAIVALTEPAQRTCASAH